MHALPAPPLFLVVRQITPLQLLGAVPFHVQDRHHHQFHPAFDTLESPKTILMEPQRRFQFLEVQLDLPAQSVPLHDLPARQAQVIGHEDFLNLDPLMLVRFLTCREDQLHLAHRVYRLSPGVDIIRPGFHFSAHAARTQSPLGDESSLTGVQPHGYQLIGLQTVDQRSYFAALASGARQHSLRVHSALPRCTDARHQLPEYTRPRRPYLPARRLWPLPAAAIPESSRPPVRSGCDTVCLWPDNTPACNSCGKTASQPAGRQQQSFDETMAAL